MIILSRLDGSRIAVNGDQIERIDEGHTTVITMMNGNSYLVAESLDTVVDAVWSFRHDAGTNRRQGRRVAKPSPRQAHLRLADPSSAATTKDD